MITYVPNFLLAEDARFFPSPYVLEMVGKTIAENHDTRLSQTPNATGQTGKHLTCRMQEVVTTKHH